MSLLRTSLILVAVLGGIGAVYFGQRNSEAKAKLLAGLHEEAELQERELWDRATELSAWPAPAHERRRSSGLPISNEFVALTVQMETLAASVSGVEEIARRLEQRITRSSLATASREEVKKTLETLLGELLTMRKKLGEDYTSTMRLAGDLNVKFDVLDPGLTPPPVLARHPGFMEARKKLLFSQNLLNAFEQQYQATMFTLKLTRTEPTAPATSLPPLPTRPILGEDPADADFPLKRLSAAIARLEIVVADLTERLVQAQSVLPTKEEKTAAMLAKRTEMQAKIGPMRAAVDRDRASLRASFEELRQIVRQSNAAIDAEQFRDVTTVIPPELANHPKFLAAREKLLFEQQLFAATEAAYGRFQAELK